MYRQFGVRRQVSDQKHVPDTRRQVAGDLSLNLLIASHLDRSRSSILFEWHCSASSTTHLPSQQPCTLTTQLMHLHLHTHLWYFPAERAPSPPSPIYLYTSFIEFLYLHWTRRPLPVNSGLTLRKNGLGGYGGCFEVSEGWTAFSGWVSSKLAWDGWYWTQLPYTDNIFSVATSILRAHYLPFYLALVKPLYSSDPFPFESSSLSSPSLSIDPSDLGNIYAMRGRETAVLDKFVATRVGEELRRVESELSEGSEAERDIFGRLQVSLFWFVSDSCLINLIAALIPMPSSLAHEARTFFPPSHKPS